MNKLWSKRFSKENTPLMEQFNASIFFDSIFFEEDINGSMAHSMMLNKIGILSEEELEKMLSGLEKIKKRFQAGEVDLLAADEDIHTLVEKQLRAEVGDLAGKLHTARSRNDQVNNDIRLYLRSRANDHREQMGELLQVFLNLAKEHQEMIMPGYTHLQPAQPITVSFYLLAYFFKFDRDMERLEDAVKRINRSPLGSGALAGVNYPVDREMVAEELGFTELLPNALDAVSDRDFIIEYSSVLSIIMVHLSRIAEEFIFFCNPSLGFIEVDEAYSTGSSIMPNKKNPDSLELIRGKSGRVIGNLISILTVMKSLPLAYNKDLQEDKEGIFDSIDTVSISLSVMIEVLRTLKFKPDNLRQQCELGYLQATDIADYLVKKGIPFRNAHEVSAGMVRELSKAGKDYHSLSLADFKNHSELFEEDIFEVIKLEAIINNKQSKGSTSFASVREQLDIAAVKLKDWQGRVFN